MTPIPLLTGLLILLLSTWLILSTAFFFAARVVAGSRATFLNALGFTFVGILVFNISTLITSFIFGSLIGSLAAFIVWLALIRSFFQTGWLGALVISILSVFMLILVVMMLGFILLLLGLPLPPEIPRIPTIRF